MSNFRNTVKAGQLLAVLLALLVLPWFYACPPAGPRLIPPTPIPWESGDPPTPKADEPEQAGLPVPEEREGKTEHDAPAPADFESLRLFTVPGNASWTDTGLEVAEGQKLIILAEGAISLQKGNPTAVCGPDGYGLKTVQQPLPDRNIGALIGRVVLFLSSRVDLQTGKEVRDEMVNVFPIGSRGEVTVPQRGRLYLGVNELVVGDNEGAYNVKLYLLR